MKKPPGEPGGLFFGCGVDAVRRNQLHEAIMHKPRGGTTALRRLLLPDVTDSVRPPS
jgi:hypothetical protein